MTTDKLSIKERKYDEDEPTERLATELADAVEALEWVEEEQGDNPTDYAQLADEDQHYYIIKLLKQAVEMCDEHKELMYEKYVRVVEVEELRNRIRQYEKMIDVVMFHEPILTFHYSHGPGYSPDCTWCTLQEVVDGN